MKSFALMIGLTWREIVRAKIPHASLLFLTIMIGAALFAGSLTFESSTEVAVDLALAGAALFAAGLAILMGIELVGAAGQPRFYPLLAGGLPRSVLFGARLLVVALAVALFAALTPLALRLAFALAGRSTGLLPEIRAASFLLPLECVILVSFSAFLAMTLARPLALALSVAVWIVAHLHPDPLTYVIVFPGWSGLLLEKLGLLMPDLELYNPLVYGATLREMIGAALIQAAIWTGLASAGALAVFEKKDLT